MARYGNNRSFNGGGKQRYIKKLKKQVSTARRSSANNYKKAKNFKLMALGAGAIAAFSFFKK